MDDDQFSETFSDEDQSKDVTSDEEQPTSSSSKNKKRPFVDLQKLAAPFSPVKTRHSLTNPSNNDSNRKTFEVEKHVRLSEKIVRDDIYLTRAELVGHGFSYHECQIALKVIANRLFNCNWTIPDESRGRKTFDDDHDDNDDECDEVTYDSNSLPTRKTIRDMMKFLKNAYEIRIQHVKNVVNSYVWDFEYKFNILYSTMQICGIFGILANLVCTGSRLGFENIK